MIGLCVDRIIWLHSPTYARCGTGGWVLSDSPRAMQKLQRDRAVAVATPTRPPHPRRAGRRSRSVTRWEPVGSLHREGARVAQAKEQSVTGHCAPAGRTRTTQGREQPPDRASSGIHACGPTQTRMHMHGTTRADAAVRRAGDRPATGRRRAEPDQ